MIANNALSFFLFALLASSPRDSASAVAEIPPEATGGTAQNQECIASPAGECAARRRPAAGTTSVYVIGDLHGDAICAVGWVNRTGLIAGLLDDDLLPMDSLPLFRKLNDPSAWRWTDGESTLVFMGDYVDKGPTSRQTVEFVRDLTVRFPDKVTALLGNHELELLRDRDPRIAPADRYGAYAYATVHPGEYQNYFRPKDSTNGSSSNAKLAEMKGGGVPDMRAWRRQERERTRREAREAAAAEEGGDHPVASGNEGDGEDAGAEPSSQAEVRSLDDEDDLVLDLLYEAAMEVYAAGAHSAVRFVPSVDRSANSAARRRGIMYAIADIVPPQHRALVRERLAEYADAYLDAYRSGTELGDWVERRPVAHVAEDVRTLFVHGGVGENVGGSYFSMGKESADKLNEVWWKYSHEDRLYDFLDGKIDGLEGIVGHVVYELLTYRGNHPGYGRWETHGTFDDDASDADRVCETLRDTLARMEGVDRIAVGHTPGDDVRILCDGAFLALDSTLGRWIRGSGNEYCPGPEHFARRRGVDVPRTSRDGRYRCDVIKDVCEGQIVRLDSDGSVNVLTL